MVRRLLERDEANPDPIDNGRPTPFSYGASCGNTEVVKILLTSEAVNYKIPLMAAKHSDMPLRNETRVVKIVLELEEVIPTGQIMRPEHPAPLLHDALE